jgi:hypothetical protein
VVAVLPTQLVNIRLAPISYAEISISDVAYRLVSDSKDTLTNNSSDLVLVSFLGLLLVQP